MLQHFDSRNILQSLKKVLLWASRNKLIKVALVCVLYWFTYNAIKFVKNELDSKLNQRNSFSHGNLRDRGILNAWLYGHA